MLSANTLCKQFRPWSGQTKYWAGLDLNCLTLRWYSWKNYLKMSSLKKISRQHLTLKAPITTTADDKLCDIFPNSPPPPSKKKKRYGILWESSAHEISCLICYFQKGGKIWNCRLLQIIGGTLWVKNKKIPSMQRVKGKPLYSWGPKVIPQK